jgi:sporulation protein YlmC with PRC-barrel domain
MMMTKFESKTLKKTFDKIVFGTLAGSAPAAPAAMPAQAHAAAGAAATAEQPIGKIAKATGADARTVAEVVAQGAQLKNRSVTVRAKVVKVSNNIMGKNWVRVRDGSGSAADGSNELLVTTKQVAAVGDVVVVKGTVHTNVDLGSGYFYKVLIEDATLAK